MSVHRTLIVPAAIVDQVRALADQFGPAAQNMWTTPLSASGNIPATHYISAGQIDEIFAELISSPQNLVDISATMGVSVTLDEATFILSQCDVSADEPAEIAMSRIGLKIIQESI
ncbi:hypothetical protein V2P20_08985 [Methylobacter sp. Wu1]|uniref:hypothetical protein n=1 Tax=Methylobacter sp. Wu1 TaxID=3119359 RepID=UPI002F93EF62